MILDREADGALKGAPMNLGAFKPKAFKTERRQFAEAILSRAVLVVEGSTEAGLLPEASTIMETSLGADAYTHLDLAGVSLFDASSETAVPKYGPMFKAVFGFCDKPNKPLTDDAKGQLADYTRH